jgi:hypothetical protein
MTAVAFEAMNSLMQSAERCSRETIWAFRYVVRPVTKVRSSFGPAWNQSFLSQPHFHQSRSPSTRTAA